MMFGSVRHIIYYIYPENCITVCFVVYSNSVSQMQDFL